MAASVVLAASALMPAQAQGEADFFKGKTVRIIVGFSPGGGTDLFGRAFADHLGRHLPGNPTVIVQNMPGAGSLASVNYIYNIAPKDGTAMATFGCWYGPVSAAILLEYHNERLRSVGRSSRISREQGLQGACCLL